jgi:hypothetical protein
VIEEWSLVDMLTISDQLHLIHRDFNRMARKITDYRNIIHPTYEVRMSVDQIDHLAPISVELVKMLIAKLKTRTKAEVQ